MTKVLLLVTCVAAICASEAAGAEESLYSQYDPTSTFQFGRPHPDAPPEIEQFDFLIGSFHCDSELFVPSEGTLVPLETRWRGEYTLNGWAIQDWTWNGILSATSIRLFNVQSHQWEVTFFMQPYLQTGVWKGGREGDDIVLARTMNDDVGPFVSRLTFFDISDSGFKWISEYVRDGDVFHTTWSIECRRMPDETAASG